MKCWTHLGFTICIFYALSMIISLDCEDVTAQKENYVPDYEVYHNLSSLIIYLKNLKRNYVSYIKLSDKYISKSGESQLLVRVSNFSSKSTKGVNRVKIFLVYGEHAREFFPVESLIYFLNNVTAGTDCIKNTCKQSDYHYAFSAWILSNFDIYIIAMTNPDGRRLIERTKNYCWRGTAAGVDLNRNFDWNYGQKGSSSDPNDGEYRGLHPFSEPETKIYQEISKDVTLDAFLSFHSGIRHIYIPFADSLSRKTHRVPYNSYHMKQLADKMSKASPSRPFKYGVAADLTGYFADGTSFDYMSGVKKVPFSIAIELWQHKQHQGRSCFDEFNPHSNNLQIELALVHPLYVELLSYLYQWKMHGTDREGKKPLVRLKKDGDHQRFPERKDAMFPSQVTETQEEPSYPSQMKFMVALIPLIFAIYLVFRLILNRKKRIVSLKSLSSTFSLFKNL